MNYQSYEDYMRSILGYSPYTEGNYTYTNEKENMFNYANESVGVQTVQDLTSFYPEIYNIMYPMVCKVCNVNLNRELTKELLEDMTDEIYRNMEPMEQDDNRSATLPPLKNGDVRNPNSKDPEPVTTEKRQSNFLLRDLIRILLLTEWGRPNRPPMRPGPGMPLPPNRPGMGPNRPPMGPPPPPRPRYF